MLAAIVATAVSRAGRRAGVAFLVAAVGLAIGSQWLAHIGPVSPLGNGTSTIYGTMMAVDFALVILAVTLHAGGVTRVLDARPLGRLGLISYGIFLWHFPVIDVLQRDDAWMSSAYANLPIVVGLTIPLAMASWLLVERRALALKQPALRDGLPPRAAVPTAAPATS